MDSFFAGPCEEPNFTTPSGIPICSKCGDSTRNRNALVCAPCRNGTRLMLTDEDKHFLRAVGISHRGLGKSVPTFLLTTEAAIRTEQQMSPEEKAKLREQMRQQLNHDASPMN